MQRIGIWSRRAALAGWTSVTLLPVTLMAIVLSPMGAAISVGMLPLRPYDSLITLFVILTGWAGIIAAWWTLIEWFAVEPNFAYPYDKVIGLLLGCLSGVTLALSITAPLSLKLSLLTVLLASAIGLIIRLSQSIYECSRRGS
ncbi:hypothetical protein HMPREF1487_09266 [Pseudomonas sp. HPB0071]|nr:hypothetical protein HMPREF1487_09266 [Pseudomonas sp. HPB0071]